MIELGATVTFQHSRRGTRRYLHLITGQVASISDGHATVIDGYRLYVVALDQLTVVDAETHALLGQAGALS